MKTFKQYCEGLKDPKDNPCWKGYEPVGTKKKNGKTVPNCVPKEEACCDECKEPNFNEEAEFGLYEGRRVPLERPMFDFSEEEELNKPKRGGPKKYYVYVKDPKSGNVKKVNFGAADGGANLSVKFDDDEARKSFVSRHDCANKTDKTSPGYWSCRLPKYAAQLGLKGGGDFFW